MQNLSQKKLASRIGVTYAEKSYRENIVNIPHVRDCRRLADASGVSIDNSSVAYPTAETAADKLFCKQKDFCGEPAICHP